ncbi:MAG: hypothetical protein M3457_18555 [Chloroflexota bacterium]|nr:hypothetical protein [Chloroflexota bacterium]
MFRRLAFALISLLMLFPFVPTSATAGGWAAVVLNTPLEEVVMGEETTIEFQVLAHARPEAAMPGMKTDFLFLHKETGFFVAVSGEATADPEVYTITFTLDQAGDWELRSMIHNYAGRPLLQKFPTLVASAPTDSAGG